MYPFPLLHSVILRGLAAVLVALATVGSAASAQTPAQRLHEAFYLEQTKGDFAAAAKLYAQVAEAGGAPAELRSEARSRLAACQEELAATDFARLLPPEPLAFVELNRPGERLGRLLEKMGLLATPGGQPLAPGQNRLAISPDVVNALLGVRGCALAITGFDPTRQQPMGVVVLHPGDVELIRGLIETALPVQSDVVDPIDGYPTYRVEGVYVTLTKRLMIAATSPAEIEAVLERTKDAGAPSLAANPDMADVLKQRGDALLFFCVNPKPLMPLLNVAMAGAAQSREVALVRALLDPQSLRSLSGRFDLSDQGVVLEVALRLDKGHRNLVYNFLRRPAIDPATLRGVPAGSAALLALAMNAAPAQYATPAASADAGPPIVTALDLGRELFANINGIAICLMPPVGDAQGPVPDLAAIITVNDPAKSQAFWQQMLGIASVAGGAPSLEGAARDMGGVPVRSYRCHEGVTVHMATVGHSLLVASTEPALERCLKSLRDGPSVLDDTGLAGPLGRLGPNTTLAVLAHPGRCLEVAKRYMSSADAAEVAPVAPLLAETTATLTVEHSNETLRLALAVAGVPDVSGLVSQMLTEQRRGEQTQQDVTRAIRQKEWDKALTLLDQQLTAQPGNTKVLRRKFDILAVRKDDPAAATQAAEALYEGLRDNAAELNNFAWELLTEDKYQHKYNDLALRLARRSNELTNHAVWAYVDTLALAEFETGSAARAIELEKKAIELCRKAGGSGLKDLETALARFAGAASAP